MVSFRHCVICCFNLLIIINKSTSIQFSGIGSADITGLITEGLLFGYSNPNQDARGIHTRQFSRAFVFSDGKKLAAIAIIETCTLSQAVHKGVLENLRVKLGGNFSESNVMLLPTHSHATPGGYHTYWLYQTSSKGFINETYQVLVNGITQSIVRAYENLQPSQTFIKSGDLIGASINRSPYAYHKNPKVEIDQYEYDTDKTMHILKFIVKDKLLGLISLFPVHSTSLKNYNHLVSSDNKGYASLKMEAILNPGKLPGKGKVLAAFGQTASGDASPNTEGSRCQGTDQMCSDITSTCPNSPMNPKLCVGRGPHGEQFTDGEIIGHLQFKKSKELLEQEGTEITGSVDHRFAWVKMSKRIIKLKNKTYSTCLPAMGYSFAAGATDGPGISPFTQGRLHKIDYIESITDLLFNKSEQEHNCHFPKPILLPTGQIEIPYPWQPEIVPLQMIKLGFVFLVGVPAEVTTMAGRRLQKAIKETLIANGLSGDIIIIIMNMANSYSSYITTYQEYQVQRYEGASNIFGPHSLTLYIEEFKKIALALVTGNPIDGGKHPPDLRWKQRNALRRLKTDILPKDKYFGQALIDANDSYSQGDVVEVTFLSGNPRNDPMINSSFLEILKKDERGDKTLYNESWTSHFNDASWETKMLWKSACHDNKPSIFGQCTINSQLSNVTITWNVPKNQSPGHYMVVHYGTANNGGQQKYVGTSKIFQITELF